MCGPDLLFCALPPHSSVILYLLVPQVRSYEMARKHSIKDDQQLAALGHAAELNRHFSPLSMLGLAFAILNSWTALAASLSLALPSGGPTSVLWGLMTAVSPLG